jgi:glutamine amidotransferase
MRATVVDYGLGNLYSVARALGAAGADVVVSSDPDEVARAERLVLPGVGAFGDGMAGLAERGLIDPIKRYADSGRPLLGICLGTQLLLGEGREFGTQAGLGVIPGAVVPFERQTAAVADKIPHVGWNALRAGPGGSAWDAGLLADTPEGSEVYFTHSFVLRPEDPGDVVALTHYAGQDVSAVIERENVHGCQFHPEKSGPAGLRILRRFLELAA